MGVQYEEIPSAIGYYASSDGDVYDKNYNKLETIINNRGYKEVIVNGRLEKVHELVINAFKPEIPSYINGKAMANHFDLDRANNNILNLDWVDNSLNAIHSTLMRNENPSSTKLKTIDDDMSVNYYTSIYECAKYVGLTLMEIWEAIKSGNEVKGLIICYLSRNERERLNSISRLHSFNKVVSVYSIIDDDQHPDIKVWELAKEINVSPQLIMEHITTEFNEKTMLGEYFIGHEGEDFSSLTKETIDKCSYNYCTFAVVHKNPLLIKTYVGESSLKKLNLFKISSDDPKLGEKYRKIIDNIIEVDGVHFNNTFFCFVPLINFSSPESYALLTMLNSDRIVFINSVKDFYEILS